MYNLLFADKEGRLFEHAGLGMTGRWGDRWVEPQKEEIIPLPQGATLTMLPGRLPVAIEKKTGRFQVLTEHPFSRQKGEVWAVGALLPQGYTRTLLPGFAARQKAKPLPLLGYTAVGIKDGDYVVAAVQTDEDDKWNPRHYNTPDLEDRINAFRNKHPDNRIVRQLARCALEYSCFTAQNIFYGRWEGGIPVSPACNARCLGCISLQPSQCCPSPQQRIDFVPAVEEVVQVALPHLEGDRESIVSFGQGCEGEPALQADIIAQAITMVRQQTARGTINANTNAGLTTGIARMVDAGLDSIRVSLVSADPGHYQAYYRARGYSLADVANSLKLASGAGVFTALNLLVFPGVSDREEEVEKLVELVETCGVRQIQLRNLNIDPDRYFPLLPPARGECLGIPGMIETLRYNLPGVAIGNYTRPIRPT